MITEHNLISSFHFYQTWTHNDFCSGGGHTELQYFIRTPRNTSVAEGDTAVLVCQVGNLKGRVQWTKDGLTLGNYISILQEL